MLGEETQCQPVDQLSSNQEEADTKMFLASKVAQEAGCSDTVIYTVDSDVAILALYYARRLSIHLFLQLGTESDVRILDIQATDWLSDLLEALPSLHAISGCDSVSAFHGLGKGKWLSTLLNKEEDVEAMRLLGESLQITESLFCTIERMVCHLYGMPEEHDIDNARYKMFCRSKTPEPYQLPPTKDELLQHIKRANYQSFVWKQALDSSFEVESPVGHGWQENDGNLEVMEMERKPAPESVLELITCTCRRSVSGEECQCRLLSLECTDLR